MIDASASYLETHRFYITDKSATILNTLDTNLPTIQQDIPEIAGYGFWGSRTLGREKTQGEIESGTKPSDLDIVVFYDGSAFQHSSWSLTTNENTPPPLRIKNGQLFIDRDEINSQTEKNKKRLWTIQTIQKNVTEQINNVITLINQECSVQTVDISPKALDTYIDRITHNSDIWSYIDTDKVPRDEKLDPYMEATILLFNLAVGKDVYHARSYFLDSLQANSNGDKFFQVIMKYLQYWERTKDTIEKKRVNPIEYKGILPSTIAEARTYFRTSP